MGQKKYVYRKIMAENFLNVIKNFIPQIQEIQQTIGKINAEKTTTLPIIVKVLKTIGVQSAGTKKE